MTWLGVILEISASNGKKLSVPLFIPSSKGKPAYMLTKSSARLARPKGVPRRNQLQTKFISKVKSLEWSCHTNSSGNVLFKTNGSIFAESAVSS